MEIKQIFSAIKHWIWLLILGVVIGAGLGYFLSSRQTPIYQASTRFVILRAAQTTYDYYSYLDNTQLIDTYAQLLTTEDTLLQASTELGFTVNKGQASATKIPDTQFIQLTVKDTDPIKAAAIANGLVKVLIDQNERLQTVRYDTAEKNLQNRIDESQAQISSLEKQISDLSTIAVSEQISKVQTQMSDVQSQINQIKLEMNKINPLSTKAEDLAAMADYQAKLDELTPILALYQQIYTNLVVLGTSGDTKQTTGYSQLDQLNTTLNLYQQIYISSINSLETLRLAKAQNTPNVVQVEKAVEPTGPISPRPVMTAAVAGTIGLILTGLVVFLFEYFDDTLKTPDDVKNLLGLPVIGFIAEVRRNEKIDEEAAGMYIARQPRSPVAEAFRSLRTNLEYSSIDDPLRIILITSSGEAEGKSTIASNLAIVEAQSGKKVLILDADMRRPKVHSMFGLSNRLGLSDLVAGKHETSEVVKKAEGVDNLDIITCGKMPPNPAELLGSDRMRSLFEEYRKTYDFVIVDSPPMIVTDAQILSTITDGVIFVLIPGKTAAMAAIRPLEELNRIGAKVLGVVMNRIPKNRDYYYGGYNYYSPYRTYGESHRTSGNDEGQTAEQEPEIQSSPVSMLVRKLKKESDKEDTAA